MRVKAFLFFTVSSFFLATSVFGQMTAGEIIKKSWDTYSSGVSSEIETLESTLVQGGRQQKKVSIRETRFLSEGKEIKVSFLSPTSDVGTEMRIIQKQNLPDVIYLKMKSWNKERRISGSQLASPFLWEITREDVGMLSGENTNDFNYSLATESEVAWVIQALPKSRIESNYSERKLWVDKKSLAIIRVEYYKNNELEKVQEATGDPQAINAVGAWRVDKISIKNLKRNREMQVKVVERKITEGEEKK